MLPFVGCRKEAGSSIRICRVETRCLKDETGHTIQIALLISGCTMRLMSGSSALHPFFRHFQILLCAMCATATVILSFVANAHSGSWLMGVYISLGLFLVALRSER